MDPFAREHDAGLGELLVVLAHRLEQLRARKLACFALGGRLDDDDDTHRDTSWVGIAFLSMRRTRRAGIDTTFGEPRRRDALASRACQRRRRSTAARRRRPSTTSP